MTIAWPETAQPAVDVSSFDRLRQWFLAGLEGAGSVLAEELATRFARLALASRPEAESKTSRGDVVCKPDPLDPGKPFWRDDEVRFSLDELGKVHWVDGEPAVAS